jgi:hypothetical protein
MLVANQKHANSTSQNYRCVEHMSQAVLDIDAVMKITYRASYA